MCVDDMMPGGYYSICNAVVKSKNGGIAHVDCIRRLHTNAEVGDMDPLDYQGFTPNLMTTALQMLYTEPREVREA